MSWELKHLERRGWNHRAGSPVALIGFVLCLMAMSTTVGLYLWLLAWIAPLILVAVFVIASLFVGKYSQRLQYLADGALAAVAFGIVFAIVGAIGLAN
jgi:energy-coupling factor transporter transmembrane protein EcfT